MMTFLDYSPYNATVPLFKCMTYSFQTVEKWCRQYIPL
ncbi:hypothetical protein JOD18_004410 [Gracilibacillus alcaliphilus]|nr:hypothetical protein [Gracilibacillus alcaliphilus]